MKKYILAILILTPLSSLVLAQQDKFILKGKVTGQSKGYIHLRYQNSEGKKIDDSCALSNGSFQFTGSIKEPTICYFNGEMLSQDMSDPNFTSFFLEPATVSISLKKDDFKHAVINGSKAEDENQMLFKQKESVREEMKSLNDAYELADKAYRDAAASKANKATLNSLLEKIVNIRSI